MVSSEDKSNNIITEVLPPSSWSGLLGQIYTDVASPSLKKIGKALDTVFDFGYVHLALPLQYKNDEKRLVLEQNFEMYREKMTKVKDEDVVEVLPELGVPIIQRLTYTRNKELADLFTNLLVSASSKDKHAAAHPTFLRILESISVDEARILKYFSTQTKIDFPCIMFTGVSKVTGVHSLTGRYTGIVKKVELDFPDNEHIYIDNLVALGLLALGKGRIVEPGAYNELEESYADVKSGIAEEISNDPYDRFANVATEYGYYERTNLAQEFLKICIVD